MRFIFVAVRYSPILSTLVVGFRSTPSTFCSGNGIASEIHVVFTILACRLLVIHHDPVLLLRGVTPALIKALFISGL